MMMIHRKTEIRDIRELLEIFPVVTILGARQTGKTTLARQFPFQHYFDLENPRDLARLDNPQLALESLRGLIVIDEIQRVPDLFPLIRYLVDNREGQKYLILGSASRDLIKQSSESLAGRIGHYYLGGFCLSDVGIKNIPRLWVRGGLPPSFLSKNDRDSILWRENYISTFLERDVPQLGISISAQTLRRFWVMISHYHGQMLNYSELGRSFGISDVTIRKYVDILEGTFMVRVLQPWHTNVKKRLVKRPKIYLRDSGIFHTLMSIATQEQLMTHPKLGASWEGFAMECTIGMLRNLIPEAYFWRTHGGAEVDLFWRHGGRSWAIEFKYVDAPRKTRSMQIAVQDLELEHLWIIYPGSETYALGGKITALPLVEANHILSSLE